MFFNQRVTVARDKPGAYKDGVWVPGVTLSHTVLTSVQPAGKNDLEMLPEGRRQARSFVLYTSRPLRGADDAGDVQPDRVKIAREWYEVVRVEPWRNNLINHYRTVVVRMQEP